MSAIEVISLTTEVQGDTGTASQIKIAVTKGTEALGQEFAARVRVCNLGSYVNATNATIAPVSGKGSTVKTWTGSKDLEICGVTNRATVNLNFSGVVIDAETFTIGTRVYEFDDNSVILANRVAVNISAFSVKAQGRLTIAEPVTVGDTIQIGTKTYVFVANGTGNTDGEIDLGSGEAATKVNIVAAINGTDAYSIANATVSAATFSADICTLTAKVGGTAGNSITTVELGQGLTHASNIFNAATLGTTTAGVSCTAANAVLAIVKTISNDAGATVTAVDGASNSVDFTAIAPGTAPNSYSTVETCANGAFGTATLLGGTAAKKSEFWVAVTNATAEPVTLRIGQPEFGGVFCGYSDQFITVNHEAP